MLYDAGYMIRLHVSLWELGFHDTLELLAPGAVSHILDAHIEMCSQGYYDMPFLLSQDFDNGTYPPPPYSRYRS